MDKSQLKELVMHYFNLEEKSTATEEKVAMAAAKLIDGTEIHTMGEGGFEVGQVAHVMTEEGEMVTAPSGEHELEDGTVLVIDGEGVITGLKTKDAEGEGSLEAAEETPEAELPAMTEMAEEGVEEALEEEEVAVAMEESEGQDVREAIIEAIAEVVAPELEAMKTKLAEMEEKMKEHYAATPASESSLEKKFSKTESKTPYWASSTEKMDFKKMQYDAVLERAAKNKK